VNTITGSEWHLQLWILYLDNLRAGRILSKITSNDALWGHPRLGHLDTVLFNVTDNEIGISSGATTVLSRLTGTFYFAMTKPYGPYGRCYFIVLSPLIDLQLVLTRLYSFEVLYIFRSVRADISTRPNLTFASFVGCGMSDRRAIAIREPAVLVDS